MGSITADVQDGIAELAVAEESNSECDPVASVPEQDVVDTAAAAVASGDEQTPAATDVDCKQQQLQSSVLDPALKQALIDSNRATVLKLEEAVLQFAADTSSNSLEFEPSTSNYERLLQHKVAQHHLLQTSTLTQTGAPRVVVKRPEDGKSRPQVPKLCDVDVSTIKIEPKALIRRPPSANSMKGADGNSSAQQQQQQRKQTHKEREADYHEARERLLGNSLAHGGGSTGNLAAQAAAGSNAGSRPGSAGAGRAPAAAGAGFLAAMPRAGERGFNIVNAGRGAGRGSINPGRGSGAQPSDNTSSSVTDAAAADAALQGVDEHMQAATVKQQKQQHKQHKQQQQPPKQPQRQQQQQQEVPRGPKAVYKDKQRDVQDPDYARGVDRFQARFDPGSHGAHGNMYNMPSYGSEFPSLGMAAGGPPTRTAHPSSSASSSRQHPAQPHAGGSAAASNGAARGGAAPRHHQPGVGCTIPGQQQHLQQYPPQFQQQQLQAAPWGYYPAAVGDPVAANAMYGQMAAPGSWGYGNMGGAMDPNMAAAYQYGWGWGVPAGGMPPYAAAGYTPYGMMGAHQQQHGPTPLPQPQQYGHADSQGARRRGANSSKGVSKGSTAVGPTAGSGATPAANGSNQ